MAHRKVQFDRAAMAKDEKDSVRLAKAVVRLSLQWYKICKAAGQEITRTEAYEETVEGLGWLCDLEIEELKEKGKWDK